MGHPYTSKYVLFDEAQLDIPTAASLEELESGLYDLISDEIAPYDDLDDCSIEIDWIASERLDADWTTSFSEVLSECTGLPDFLIDGYNASGSTAEIKDWLSTSLETGASYRQGQDDIHKTTLWSLERSRVPGFATDSFYCDSQEEEPCDARPEDFGSGKRIVVEMRVYWAL